MPPGPPDDRDSAWDDLLAQVRDALREAGLRPDDESAVEDGLRAALEQLGDLSTLIEERSADGQAGERPDVEVVEGGRTADDPPTPRAGPKLHIAGEGDVSPGEPPARPGVETTVRLVRLPAGRTSRDPGLGREGAIRLESGQQQTIFRGGQARPYRVACTRGVLTIAVDGLPAEVLRGGQTFDVEAALVRVSTDAPDGAEGRYVRLH